MIKILTKEHNFNNNKKAKDIWIDYSQILEKKARADFELTDYHSKIKEAEKEFGQITSNLQKAKLDFEILFSKQKLMKKEILQLEKEHKFILTELASLGKRENTTQTIVDDKAFSYLCTLIRQIGSDLADKKIKNQTNKSMSRKHLLLKQNTKLQNYPNIIKTKEKFQYF